MSRDAEYPEQILGAIAKIERYVSVGRDAFISEPHWHDATMRQIEFIGEAAKRLSPAFRYAHPETPWKRMAGMRDVLTHKYDDVDLAVVWSVTQRSIPALKGRIEAILENERS